jgi:hypothetical protein
MYAKLYGDVKTRQPTAVAELLAVRISAGRMKIPMV